MRRSEKEIADQSEINEVLERSAVCRIGMVDSGIPYIVPVNYAHESENIFIHCAKEGRKIDILKKNNYVCFEIEADYFNEIKDADLACKVGMKFKSLIGYGHVHLIDDSDIAGKKHALDILTRKYSTKASLSYKEEMLDRVQILKIKIEKISGKKSE